VGKLIVVVEDDHLQELPIRGKLEDAFPDAEVERIATESDFRSSLPELSKRRPDIIIIDVMLRWADLRPGFPKPPPDVVEGGYHRAGLRCAEWALRNPALRATPIVLYSILERDEVRREGEAKLGDNVSYLRKSADINVLARHLRKLISP
jgi:CheY-like chemotaxis protein